MRYIIFIFSILFANGLFSQVKHKPPVDSILIYNGLSDKEPLFLICVNANDCVNCLLPLGDLIQQINSRKINNVVYLIDGIEPSEKYRYAQTVLQLDPNSQKVITEKKFYKAVNSDPASKLIILEKGKFIYDEKVKDLQDNDYLHSILERSTKKVVLVDSLSFDSSYLHGTFASELLYDSLLITLNTRYQEISVINLKNKFKIVKNNHSLGLNADSLLTLTLTETADSSLLWYNIWLRHQKTNFFTKNPLFPDIDLMNLTVQDNNIFLVVGIPILQPAFRGNDTTHMITKIPYILRLDTNLKIQSIYRFSTDQNFQPPHSYIASLFVPFYFDLNNNTVYFKTSFEGSNDDFKTAKTIMCCKIAGNKIIFDRLLNFTYPNFFEQKGYYNDYNNCNFSLIENKPYFFFSFTPDIYSLYGGVQYKISNTKFNLTELNSTNLKQNDIQFKMQSVFKQNNGFGACYITDKQMANFVWFDQNWKEISTSSLPRQNVLRVIVRNKTLFILCEKAETGKAELYKYCIN